MGKSIRSKIKRKFRAVKRIEVYNPVVNKRQEECNNRLLVNTFLNKPTGLDAVKMVIEGEAPASVLKSKKEMSKVNGKKPFSFIERTWEVPNPTEEEIEEALRAKAAVDEYEREQSSKVTVETDEK